MSKLRALVLLAAFVSLAVPGAFSQKANWRAATDAELAALLPARAPVEKEHIETEMRTASGITDGHGRFIAGVVLITAGYSADGKYSHYLIVQSPIKIGQINLAPGEYLIGWQHDGESLSVRVHEAMNGKLIGSTLAHKLTGNTRVESLRIWPPNDRQIIQIGRFAVPYEFPGE